MKPSMKPTAPYQHKSVLVREVLTYLNPIPGGVYIDVTFGGGGHTRAILTAEPTCKVIGLDWDTSAIEHNAAAVKEEFGDRFTMLWGNFAHLYKILKHEKIRNVQGILADFGTSQFQIHEQAGFSFQKDTPLDMRMSSAHHQITARDVINNSSEKELTHIFSTYGEEIHARKIARLIVQERQHKLIATTRQLVDIIEHVIPHFSRTTHPATKVFQALRIHVNDELNNITAFLAATPRALVKGGRLVCISFHSLEDRLVKNFFNEHALELTTLTTKPITAQEDELEVNPSARSAKLRAALKS